MDESFVDFPLCEWEMGIILGRPKTSRLPIWPIFNNLLNFQNYLQTYAHKQGIFPNPDLSYIKVQTVGNWTSTAGRASITFHFLTIGLLFDVMGELAGIIWSIEEFKGKHLGKSLKERDVGNSSFHTNILSNALYWICLGTCSVATRV